MLCGFDEKILYLYHDHELSPTAVGRVEAHLENCEECQKALLSLQVLRQGLANACNEQAAPGHLQEKIRLQLRVDDSSESVILGLGEKIKMFLSNTRRSRILAGGLAMAALLLFVLLPTGTEFSHISQALAVEHMADPMVREVEFQSQSISEIESYYEGKFGVDLKLPENLGPDIDLDCGCLIYVKGKPAIHAFYKKGSLQYSLFIMNPLATPGDNARSLAAGGRVYDFGNKDEINMICWQQNRLTYVLAGCCPYEDLVNISLASI